MARLKVLTLVGTRPELIKLSRVLAELDRTTDHLFVHSGQNYAPELYARLLDDLGLRPPDHLLDAAGDSAIDTIARTLTRFDAVLAEARPDAVLFYGDTNTGLALMAAKRRQIPIFHMEAGNRCYDARVPEEMNRRLLDHLSDINLPLSEHARRCLLAEGLPPDRIIKTGSPLKEVLAHYWPRIAASTILQELSLAPDGYFLVSAHREENVDPPHQLADLLETLETIARTYDRPVIVSTHPRTRKRLDALAAARAGRGAQANADTHAGASAITSAGAEAGAGASARAADDVGALDARIRFLNPFGFFDYVALQCHATCVLSDSGSLTEESSLLDLPAVALRQTHERHEGMDEGTVVMAGLRAEGVLQALELVRAQRRPPQTAGPAHGTSSPGIASFPAAQHAATPDAVSPFGGTPVAATPAATAQGGASQNDRPPRAFRLVDDYDRGDVSRQVVRIILSYVDYVNRTVWRKDL